MDLMLFSVYDTAAPVKQEGYLKMQTVVHCDKTSLFTVWPLTGCILASVAVFKEKYRHLIQSPLVAQEQTRLCIA